MRWKRDFERVERAALLIAFLLAGCDTAPEIQKRLIPMFGTVAEVDVVGAATPATDAALDELEALYAGLDRDWRKFGPGELGQANAALAAGRRVPLSPRLAALVERSLDMQERSDGLFDPRVGALVALWGFDDMAHTTPAQPPEAAAVADLRTQTLGRAGAHVEGQVLWSDAPLSLDLNGIAEGGALAAGAVLLRSRGITAALLDTGGDLLAIGSRGGRPWRVGVRDPRGPGILGIVELAPGEAIASSGAYEHRFEAGGRSYHHILDPRTGWPAAGAAGTTVISRDPELADAAATALMVAGPQRFTEIATRMGVDAALLVGADGRVLKTPAMASRLKPR